MNIRNLRLNMLINSKSLFIQVVGQKRTMRITLLKCLCILLVILIFGIEYFGL